MVDFLLPAPTEAVGAAAAVEACSRWSKAHPRESLRLASSLRRLVEAADASELALFAGWQQIEWPSDPAARWATG